MRIINKVLSISIINTLKFNLYYFGLKGLKFPAIVYKGFQLERIKGSIELKQCELGILQLGGRATGVLSKKEKGIWNVSGKIYVEGKAFIGNKSKIIISETGNLHLGDKFYVSGSLNLICHKNIYFGNDVIVSWDCQIMDTDFHQITNLDNESYPMYGDIYISNHVWIGSDCTILKGSFINDNSVVATKALVSKKYYDTNIIIGKYNEILKKRINWIR